MHLDCSVCVLVNHYFRYAELVSKVQENIHKCVIKCLAKDPLIKVRLAALCVQEDIVNFQVLVINLTSPNGLGYLNHLDDSILIGGFSGESFHVYYKSNLS